MSKAWAKGSTRRWRTTRKQVLDRDGHRCQLQLDGCTTNATHVHHTIGRTVTGDDPQHLVASCESCNLKIGDPRATRDPRPNGTTKW